MSTLIKNQFTLDDGDCLFRSKDFFMHNRNQGDLYLEVVKGNSTSGVSCYFNQNADGTWTSPLKGTYAGPRISGKVSDSEYHNAVLLFEKELKSRGATKIEYVLPPNYLEPSLSTLTSYALWSSGYHIERMDMNYHIEITKPHLSSHLSTSKRRTLNKLSNEQFSLELLDHDKLPDVYRLLTLNRSSLGVKLSMELADLRSLCEKFENRVLLFGLKASDELMSAAFCLQINQAAMYVFYWGHHPEADVRDPITPLASFIYEYCFHNGIQFLDLGTSTIGSEPNWGLIFFKKSLGAKESMKLRFSKELN